MKLEVYGEEEQPEKVVKLKLIKRLGHVDLCAVDELGHQLEEGILLTISQGGDMFRMMNVSPELGFRQTKEGFIKMY